MMYGHLEKDEDIIEHLEHIRALQSETGGFTAFIPWSFKYENTALTRKVKEEAGPTDICALLRFQNLPEQLPAHPGFMVLRR